MKKSFWIQKSSNGCPLYSYSLSDILEIMKKSDVFQFGIEISPWNCRDGLPRRIILYDARNGYNHTVFRSSDEITRVSFQKGQDYICLELDRGEPKSVTWLYYSPNLEVIFNFGDVSIMLYSLNHKFVDFDSSWIKEGF